MPRQLTLAADASGALVLRSSNSEIRSVLFVCIGNIIRSPVAEGLFRHRTNRQILTDSAAVTRQNLNENPVQNAQIIGKQHGFDISGHRSRLVRSEDFSKFHLIVALEPFVYRRLMDLKPRSSQAKIVNLRPDGVLNPYNHGFNSFLTMYKQIESGITDLLARYFPQFS
jgi:protein-tyrosine phosphatase